MDSTVGMKNLVFFGGSIICTSSFSKSKKRSLTCMISTMGYMVSISVLYPDKTPLKGQALSTT